MAETGTLYLVSTPIGNLEDITLRALRVLEESALVACEDTRHSARLFDRHGISTPRTSFHEHNEQDKCIGPIDRIEGFNWRYGHARTTLGSICHPWCPHTQGHIARSSGKPPAGIPMGDQGSGVRFMGPNQDVGRIGHPGSRNGTISGLSFNARFSGSKSAFGCAAPLAHPRNLHPKSRSRTKGKPDLRARQRG